MTPEQFAYWLQGSVELNGGARPTDAQWKSIKEHLAEVFVKVTPPVESPKKAPMRTCRDCGKPERPHKYRHAFVAAAPVVIPVTQPEAPNYPIDFFRPVRIC